VVEGALEEHHCTCKIHDVMKNLVFYIFVHDNTPLKEHFFLFQDNQALEHFPPKWTTKSGEHFNVRRLSLICNYLTSLLETTFMAPNMCTLLLNNNLIQSIPKGFLKGVQNLRMLNLAFYNFEYLPKTLGDMKELRYLNFSWVCQTTCITQITW
jgi:hypothetical protein